MTKFLKEFKDFAVKGNAFDLAIGVIIGGAFGKIISSLVTDVIMPPLGVLMGGVNFSDIKINLKSTVSGADGIIISPAINLNIGIFLQNILDFLIIAVVIFLMIKLIIKLKSQLATNEIKEIDPSLEKQPETPTKDQVLLSEIRDLLKDRSQNK